MGSFAKLLEKLQGISEGAGTLLDRSCVYCTSDVSWGKTHSLDEYPVLIAGKAGGKLRGNIHLRAAGENTSKILFTIANVMGLNITELGLDEARVTSGLDPLLA